MAKRRKPLYECSQCPYVGTETICPTDQSEMTRRKPTRVPKLPKREHGSTVALPEARPLTHHPNHLLPRSEYAHFETSSEAFYAFNEAWDRFAGEQYPMFNNVIKQLRKRGGFARIGVFVEWAPDVNAPVKESMTNSKGFR